MNDESREEIIIEPITKTISMNEIFEFLEKKLEKHFEKEFQEIENRITIIENWLNEFISLNQKEKK